MPPPTSIVFVDPVVLERVESHISELVQKHGILAALLIEASGVVLACTGECPLPPSQVGSIAAGVFSAMNTLMKAARAEEFFITVPTINMRLDFHQVDSRLFLCAFYPENVNCVSVRDALRQLAVDSRNSLTTGTDSVKKPTNVSFIEEKLNELFNNR